MKTTNGTTAATVRAPKLMLMWLLLAANTMAATLLHCSDAARIARNPLPVASNNETAVESNTTWRLISRAQWRGRAPKSVHNFPLPAAYVIVHHSYQPGVCGTLDACKAAMRAMQRYHMDEHHWTDIGYSFAVGGDGNVYEGRGYGVVGAHAPDYNSRSIGLLLIGNFEVALPPTGMLAVAQSFLNYSVALGMLQADYVLYGHRQVRATACPGNALYEAITRWPHWQQHQLHGADQR